MWNCMKQILGENYSKTWFTSNPLFIKAIIIIMFSTKNGVIACVIMARVSCVCLKCQEQQALGGGDTACHDLEDWDFIQAPSVITNALSCLPTKPN